MAKRQPIGRLLLPIVIAFSMTMPATILVGLDYGNVSLSPGSNFEERAIVQTGQEIYEAWVDGPIHQTWIMFSLSPDSGRTWSEPERITGAEAVPLDVQMAAGANTLHLAWSDAVIRSVRTGYMHFLIEDGEWSSPMFFNGEYPSLAASGESVAIATEDKLITAVYTSVDNGQTFVISTPMNELACSRPAVLLDNGIINVACAAGVRDQLTSERSQQGIYFTSSMDSFIWKAPVKVAETSGSARDLCFEISQNGLKISWEELTETIIFKYSISGNRNGVFGEKVLTGSEPNEAGSEPPTQIMDSRLPQKKWTFICYCDADNSLNSAGLADINEMEMIGSNADLNIIALFDGSGSGDSKAYYVQQDSQPSTITSPQIPLTSINASWGNELNMGHPQTAIDFVNYVYNNYSATRYIIDFWDHGGSWTGGICSDDTNGDGLTMLEVRSIFEKLRSQTNKTRLFDVAGYDCCLMSDVEVAYDEMPYIDYICNSEDSIGNDGWEYNLVIGHINDDLDMDGEEAAWWVFKSYVDAWGTSGSVTTMSVINSTMFASSLCPAINSLAQKGIHEISTYRTQLQSAANNAEDWQGYSHQKDLIHFCQNINSSTIPAGNPIKLAAQAVLTAGAANPAGSQYGQPAWQHDRAIMIHNQNTNENGITIYAASPPYSSTYDTLTWIDTKWDEFYKVLWGTDSNAPNNEPLVDITSPADGGFLSTNTAATITGTASDPGGMVTRVDVGIHTQHWTAAIGTNSWSYIWNTANWPTGWYKIMARSYDGQDYSAVHVHDVELIDNLPPTVWLSAPNGGESWEAGTNHDIAWVMSDLEDPATSLAVTLDYSTNGGTTYPFNIITNQTGFSASGVYSWQVPNAPGSNLKVRITIYDLQSGSCTDASNASFNIFLNSPAVWVSSPNGGNYLMGGGGWSITWSASGGSYPLKANPITIEYSTTGPGGPWTLLASNELNDGAYSWTGIPVINNSNSYVRVTAEDAMGNDGLDISNSSFNIDSAPPIPATNVRAELTGTNNVTIYWTASSSPDVAYYQVYYVQLVGAWDPTGNSYTSFLASTTGTSSVHAGYGNTSGNSYCYQVRTYDLAGNEAKTLIQAAKMTKQLSVSQGNMGWFLVGSFLTQSSYAVAQKVQGLDIQNYYDFLEVYNAWGGADRWKTYPKNAPASIQEFSAINNTQGFWIHVAGNCRYASAGYISNMSVPMKAGWNLVPYPYAMRNKNTQQIVNDLTANCSGFSGGLPDLEIFSKTAPYKLITPTGAEGLNHQDAFWVRVNTDCIWNVVNY
jgi:hypothetical protein